MGGTQSTSGEVAELPRHEPHIDKQTQAMVAQLMKEYPKLDQLMAETIVWDYWKKKHLNVPWLDEAVPHTGPVEPQRQNATLATPPSDEHTCNEAKSGSSSGEAS